MLLPIFLAGLMLAVGMFFLREAVGLGIARDRDAARDVLVEHRFEEHYEDVAVIEDSGSLVFLNDMEIFASSPQLFCQEPRRDSQTPLVLGFGPPCVESSNQLE